MAHVRRWRGSRIGRSSALREAVFDRLAMGWSPEAIAATLKRDDGSKAVSHESIYRYAHSRAWRKDKLYKLLPRGKASRGWRVAKDPSTRIPGRVSIHDRPEDVNCREEIGHWEADLMCFADQKQALLVLTERKTRLVLAARLANKQAQTVEKEALKLMQSLQAHAKRTITFDNGGDFARHQNLSNALNVNTYFCDAHAPWQKGSVENQIGRLRNDLPRKIPLNAYSDGDVNDIILNHNDMPRKCLGWRTPFEAFINDLTQTVALQM